MRAFANCRDDNERSSPSSGLRPRKASFPLVHNSRSRRPVIAVKLDSTPSPHDAAEFNLRQTGQTESGKRPGNREDRLSDNYSPAALDFAINVSNPTLIRRSPR
jgi:hypothetical protein